MSTLLHFHPLTPNGEYRQVTLVNAGYFPAKVVEDAIQELTTTSRLIEAGITESTPCQILAAWLLSGNVTPQL